MLVFTRYLICIFQNKKYLCPHIWICIFACKSEMMINKTTNIDGTGYMPELHESNLKLYLHIFLFFYIERHVIEILFYIGRKVYIYSNLYKEILFPSSNANLNSLCDRKNSHMQIKSLWWTYPVSSFYNFIFALRWMNRNFIFLHQI